MEAFDEIIKLLKEKNIKYRVHIHSEIPTVQLAKEKVNFNINKCYKTIAFKYDEGYLFVCLKAEDSIEYSKLCSNLNIKRSRLKKADSNELEEEFGYEAGGIAPISISNKIAVIFDKKIIDEDKIFCGSGKTNKTIEINGKDLIGLSEGIVDISKSKEIEERGELK